MVKWAFGKLISMASKGTINLSRISYLCLLFVLSSVNCSAIEVEENAFQFNKSLTSQLSPFDSPSLIYKSLQGRVWLFFDHHLAIKSGDSIKKIKYAEISEKIRLKKFTPYISENNTGIYFSMGHSAYHYSTTDEQFSKLEIAFEEKDEIVSIKSDSAGNIWIASYLTLTKVDASNQIHPISFPEAFIDPEVGSPLLYSAEPGTDRRLYLGTYSFGLLSYSATNGFTQILPELQEEQSVEVMRFIGNLCLIGNSAGLYSYDIQLNQTTRLFEKQIVQAVKFITLDQQQNIFIATSNQLWRTNPQLTELVELNIQSLPLKNSKQIEINSMMSDDEGILWLSINDEGIYSYHPSRNKIVKSILNVAEEKNTQTILSRNNLLSLSNKDSSYLSEIDYQLPYQTYSYLEKEEHIYLGAKNKVIRINQMKETRILPYNGSESFYDEEITHLVEDQDKRTWIVSSETGLRVVKLTPDAISTADKPVNIPLKIKVMVLFVAAKKQNQMILSTRHALYNYALDTDTLRLIKSFKNEGKSINRFQQNGDFVYFYSADNSVYSFNLSTEKIYPLSIPVDDIGCILAHQNNWLIAQNKGKLFYWDHQELNVYDENDGLPIEGLNGKVCIESNSRYYFSGFDGIYHIQMNDSFEQSIKPNVLINRVNLNKTTLTHKDLKNQQLSIEKNEFPISFSLASSSYLMESRNRYQYRFSDSSNSWNDISPITKTVLFDALAPDDYIIEFRTANSEQIWSEPKTFSLSVSPPIWFNNWAKLSYILTLILIAYFLHSIKLRNSVKREKILEQKVIKRTNELNTEKLMVEKLLSKKNEELINISHEFRTPLTLILGYSNQLEKQAKTPEQERSINTISRNGYRLLRMVDQLLNLKTLQLNSIIPRQPINTGKALKALVDAFTILAADKSIELRLEEVAEVSLPFTPEAFERVILNLLSNAIKYTPDNGSIVVKSWCTPEQELGISIKDNGIGIATDKLAFVFEKYNRIHDDNQQAVEGTGIGLSLVKNLVEKNGGRINIQSELKFGTLVSIYFPLINQETKHHKEHQISQHLVDMELNNFSVKNTGGNPTTNTQAHWSSQTRPTLLLIEDNSDMTDFISNSLENSYHVLTAKNGNEGLEKAISEVPDIIVSDIMMPQKDGYLTTQELRKNSITNHIPIILLTARHDRDSRLKAWHEKADDFITKPFDIEELKMRLDNLLEIRGILKRKFSESLFQPDTSKVKQQPLSNDADDKIQKKFILQLNDVLEPLYTDPSVSVSTIATAAAMSERQFFRKLKSILDMTPMEYLRRFRLEKSKQLLSTGKTANYTAIEVGFSSQAYFSKCFKAQFGMPPSHFKNQ